MRPAATAKPEGQSGAVAQQQAADDRAGQRTGRHLPDGGELAGGAGGGKRAQHQADVHDGRDVLAQGRRQRGLFAPVGPGRHVAGNGVPGLGAPQRKRRGDAPGAASQRQRREVQHHQRHATPDQRPGALQQRDRPRAR
ncbi:hypothetical protein G6F65_022052 [Rhizopus arrhizus]|nr:hypothetical protein G6F65_022052 [Rhizopus arrhizus]